MKKQIILKASKLVKPKQRKVSVASTRVVPSKKIYNRKELVRAIMKDFPADQ